MCTCMWMIFENHLFLDISSFWIFKDTNPRMSTHVWMTFENLFFWTFHRSEFSSVKILVCVRVCGWLLKILFFGHFRGLNFPVVKILVCVHLRDDFWKPHFLDISGAWIFQWQNPRICTLVGWLFKTSFFGHFRGLNFQVVKILYTRVGWLLKTSFFWTFQVSKFSRCQNPHMCMRVGMTFENLILVNFSVLNFLVAKILLWIRVWWFLFLGYL